MQLLPPSTPLIRVREPLPLLMSRVLVALLPGIGVLVFYNGPGVLLQILIASISVLLAEALCVILRGRSAQLALTDMSALVTGWLLAISLPTLLPAWMTVLGCGFAIVVAKQLYGGLGQNPFNPAMVGYVVLLVSFPLEMGRWLLPGQAPGLTESLAIIMGQLPPADGLSGATPLDQWRSARVQNLATPDTPVLHPSYWVNLSFLLGGLWLLWHRSADWRIPCAMLSSLGLLSVVGSVLGDYPGVLLQLFSGATMLGAFFIATDPVSASTTPRGRWLYGAGIGILSWVIRNLGGYPDGVAFAVLLMNLSVPLLDQYTRPRVLGEP